MPITTQDNQRKTGSSSSSPKPPETSPNCPRCDSPNTKFCYYNNYSLSQPRHFCKTCRRYWTKGGALRNVPIGGGCRKTNKKSKSSSSKDSSSSSTDISSAFKFLHGLSPPLDFQFGRLPSTTNQFLSMGSTNTNTTSFMGGFNWGGGGGGVQEIGSSSSSSSMNVNTNLASSIECLSSINQDLHWKLQQQRLALILGSGENHNQNQNPNQKDKETTNINISSSSGGVLGCANGLLENQMINPQPILFQNLGISTKPGAIVTTTTANTNPTTSEWFFENPYMAITSNNNDNSNNGGGNDSLNNWNSVQPWSYNDLPQ